MPDTGLSLQTMRLLHFALGKEKCTVKKGTIRKQAGIRARQKERGKKCAVKQWLWKCIQNTRSWGKAHRRNPWGIIRRTARGL